MSKLELPKYLKDFYKDKRFDDADFEYIQLNGKDKRDKFGIKDSEFIYIPNESTLVFKGLKHAWIE